MNMQSELSRKFESKLVGGSEDEILGAIWKHAGAFEQRRVSLWYESDELARKALGLLVASGTSGELRGPYPKGHRIEAGFESRLDARVARIAFETGGRVEVPYNHPAPSRVVPEPHDVPTRTRGRYEEPKSLVARVQHAAKIREALQNTPLPLEYVVRADGRHVLVVDDAEISLDGLTPAQRKVFSDLEDYLTLSSRLADLVS
jgi:hypothetical protein